MRRTPGARAAIMLGVITLAVVAASFFLVGICADGGAMGSAYKTCECAGLEWELYDGTAVDGPRRTLCLGLIRSKTCHRFREGPSVACTA